MLPSESRFTISTDSEHQFIWKELEARIITKNVQENVHYFPALVYRLSSNSYFVFQHNIQWQNFTSHLSWYYSDKLHGNSPGSCPSFPQCSSFRLTKDNTRPRGRTEWPTPSGKRYWAHRKVCIFPGTQFQWPRILYTLQACCPNTEHSSNSTKAQNSFSLKQNNLVFLKNLMDSMCNRYQMWSVS